MKKLLFFFCLLFIFQSSSHAQNDVQIDGFKIGITPSALLNRWIGFQGKLSYTKKKIEFEANIGYLTGSDNGEHFSGYRIRPAAKYYFTENDDALFYFGFGGLHRKLNIDANGTFSRFNGSFFQELDFKISQSMNGLFAMFGLLLPMRNERFFFDGGIGFGQSKVNTTHMNVPSDARLIYSPPIFTSDTRNDGSTTYPIFFVHLSFMFLF